MMSEAQMKAERKVILQAARLAGVRVRSRYTTYRHKWGWLVRGDRLSLHGDVDFIVEMLRQREEWNRERKERCDAWIKEHKVTVASPHADDQPTS